jgi:glutamate dehydrogenase/leucine dehydrogenase
MLRLGLPTTVCVYDDPVEGFRGYIAYAGQENTLAAGGFRVQKGLTAETIEALAEAMKLKEQVLKLNVDGAKCGIDYDPCAPGKRDAMRRFLRFLRPHLDNRLSVGPDMGTTFSEIEALAREEGIATVKAAVGRAQGLSDDEVLRRLAILGETVDGMTLGERRSGHGLAHAVLAVLRHVAPRGARSTVALHGFGTLGRGAAVTLARHDVSFLAVADEWGSARRAGGLDVEALLALPRPASVVELPGDVEIAGPADVFAEDADVLVLAALEDAMTEEQAAHVRARAVVVGANHGLGHGVEALLHERGILVVPDFIGGSGGSASMDALFASPDRPTAEEVLVRQERISHMLIDRLIGRMARDGAGPRAAAMSLAAEADDLPPSARPYGLRLVAG